MGSVGKKLGLGLLGVAVAVAVLAPAVTPAVAADNTRESITLTPTSKRYVLDTNETKQDTINVINDGALPYTFIVYARPYSVKDESYDPNFTDTPSNADAYQWIQFDQTTWTLQPGQEVKIPYTVRVPGGAAPGGHYGVMFAETQPSPAEVKSGSVIRKKRVGTIIYATVKGTFRTGGEYLSSSIPWLQFRAPLEATATVKNTGNADFDLESTYRITDVFGNLKYELKTASPVLPQTARKVKYDWPAAPWFGLYHVRLESHFLSEDAKVTDSFVLMIPRWLLVTLGVAVVGGGAYAVLRRRR